MKLFLHTLIILEECRLKSNSIFDVDKKEVQLGSSRNCELLVIGECSSLPRFAIIRLPSPHGIGLKIYTGGWCKTELVIQNVS